MNSLYCLGISFQCNGNLVTLRFVHLNLMFFHLEILTSPVTGDNDDVIGDSEDEATKNFKGRVRIDPVEVTLEYQDAPLAPPHVQ